MEIGVAQRTYVGYAVGMDRPPNRGVRLSTGLQPEFAPLLIERCAGIKIQKVVRIRSHLQ
jgi:hypothetical protein